MTSVGALPPALPRSRQSAAATAEGGEAFAAMLAGFGAVTAAPTASSPPPQGPAVASGPLAGVSATGPLGAGIVLAGVTVGPAIAQVQAAPVQAGVIEPGLAEVAAVEVGPAPTPVQPPSIAAGGLVTSPAGLSRDPRSPVPATAATVIEIPSATPAPAAVTATAPPVPAAAPAVVPPLDPAAQAAADTTTAPATAPAVELSDDQQAGDQAGAEPEPAAPPLDAVRTDQPQLTDVRLLGTDQAVGALGEQRRTDTVAPVVAPAPAAPPPPPAVQVVQLLTPLLEGPDGAHTMSLQLHPEELGAVQVDVALLRGEITLALHARDVAAQDALRAALPMLRAELEASGLTATSLSVDGGRADQQPGERPDRPDHPGPHGGSLPGGSGDGAPAGSPVPTTSSPDAALDVRM